MSNRRLKGNGAWSDKAPGWPSSHCFPTRNDERGPDFNRISISQSAKRTATPPSAENYNAHEFLIIKTLGVTVSSSHPPPVHHPHPLIGKTPRSLYPPPLPEHLCGSRSLPTPPLGGGLTQPVGVERTPFRNEKIFVVKISEGKLGGK
ncbi:hypothetical protein CDAR_297071 [Caerostris darwini]|uniref:Uncharacterized protein n=1 Tax=Caerostris darwini TaxID=1538125 RepID=A0AAV4QC83_9ARAC|nr:hypothetical protein CDAR_297071 [Caerostris darwini]